MASNKRKQDEKHLKMLREMAALAPNKQCFDCHQRGPTYVNMTIGSFVCTSCSGILRGLNPPHRVKSISMASFTPEEMEFLKCHGNEFCRKVYLGLYDARSGAEPDSRDEQKVKDFMIQKYERKRYYVAPTDSMKAEAKQANEASMNKQPATRPLKTILGEKTPNFIANQNEQSTKQTLKSQAASVPGQISIGQIPSKDQSFHSPGQQIICSQSSGSATMDLLGDLGGDPFGSSTSAPPQHSSGEFADFSSFNQFGSQQKPQHIQQQHNAFPSFKDTLIPMNNNTQEVSTSQQNVSKSQPITMPSGGDKYSALSDLFSSSPSSTGMTAPQVTNFNWGGSSEINWSGDPMKASSEGGNIQWNSSNQGWKSEANWMSATNATATNSVSGGNLNPFGGNVSNPPQTGLATNNPFGTNQTSYGQIPTSNQLPGFEQSNLQQSSTGFGQTMQQPGGLGQFGQPSGSVFGQQADLSATGGFGQTQAPVSSFGGWGGGQQQAFVHNGAFSSAAGFGVQTVQGNYGNTHTTPSGQFNDKMGGSGGDFGAHFSYGHGGIQPCHTSANANPFMRPNLMSCPANATCGDIFFQRRLLKDGFRRPENRHITNCVCPGTERCNFDDAHMVYQSTTHREALCSPVSTYDRCRPGQEARRLRMNSENMGGKSYFEILCICPRHLNPVEGRGQEGKSTHETFPTRFDSSDYAEVRPYQCSGMRSEFLRSVGLP